MKKILCFLMISLAFTAFNISNAAAQTGAPGVDPIYEARMAEDAKLQADRIAEDTATETARRTEDEARYAAEAAEMKAKMEADEAARVAEGKGVKTTIGFFNKTTSQEIVKHFGACDLIIGNNVFAHVPKIREFIRAIKYCLSKKGVVSLEFPHLASLVEYTQFDTIYDEHYFYHSIIALTKIFSEFNLKIIEINELSTHGGSLRMFLTHEANNTHSISHSVNQVLNKELAMKLDHKKGFHKFQKKAELIRENALDFIKKRKEKGQCIIAFGAAAKGNVFLNYCGINSDDINFVVDDTPAKQGKFLPGSHIPIVAIDAIQGLKPNIIIILPWNFREEICQKLNFVKEWGGQLVTLIPEIKIS